MSDVSQGVAIHAVIFKHSDLKKGQCSNCIVENYIRPSGTQALVLFFLHQRILRYPEGTKGSTRCCYSKWPKMQTPGLGEKHTVAGEQQRDNRMALLPYSQEPEISLTAHM